MWTGNKFIAALLLLYPISAWGFATSDGLSTANYDGINLKRGPTAPPYQGPGDIVAGATGWWGLRAYSAAKAGTKAVRLRRDSDQIEQDFNTLANGSLDTASITTFKGAANLFVSKLYDQTGGSVGDLVQATTTNQPSFVLADFGSFPDMRFASQALATASLALTEPFTFVGVNIFTGAAVAQSWEGSGTQLAGHTTTANQLRLYNNFNEVHATATDNAWHGIQFVFNGAASNAVVDGVSTIGNDGGAAIASTPLNFGQDNYGELWTGKQTEMGLWLIAFSTPQITAMNTNIHTYWGF
jgi:hypothetical protein